MGRGSSSPRAPTPGPFGPIKLPPGRKNALMASGIALAAALISGKMTLGMDSAERKVGVSLLFPPSGAAFRPRHLGGAEDRAS